jgi:hypothetical protein
MIDMACRRLWFWTKPCVESHEASGVDRDFGDLFGASLEIWAI